MAPPKWLRIGFPSVCFGLGVWQLYRWRRKEALIARYHSDLLAPPLTLMSASQITPSTPHRYKLPFVDDNIIVYKWIGPRGHGKGYSHLAISLVRFSDGSSALLNLGWHQIPSESLPCPKDTIFIHDPQSESKLWFNKQVPVKNIEELGEELECMPVMLKAVWEEGVEAPFRNKHLEYVATWWSVAALSAIFSRLK